MMEKRRKGFAVAALMLHIFLIAVSVHTIATADYDNIRMIYVSNLASDLTVLLACAFVFTSILLDRRLTRNIHIFLAMLTFEAILLALDIQNWTVDGNADLAWYNTLLNYGIYIMMYVIIGSFWWYLSDTFSKDGGRTRTLNCLVLLFLVAGIGLVISNYWNDIFFTVDEYGVYHRSETFMLTMLFPSLISVVTLYSVFRFEHDLRRRLTFLSYIILPYAAAVIQTFLYGVALQYISFMLAMLLIYANIYVSRSADLIMSESEMLQQRAEAMVSQIQPHFLYNVLTSIMNIKGSSEESRDAIVDFSRYLRFNLDSTRATFPIPVTTEIDHVETYINLRRLHYGDKLELDTDIQDRGAHVPPQSLKVMVESLMESDIEDTDLMMITLSTELRGRDHVITIGYGGPSAKMGDYLESDSYRELVPTIDRLKRTMGGRFTYRYEPDDFAEIELTIPVDAKVRR